MKTPYAIRGYSGKANVDTILWGGYRWGTDDLTVGFPTQATAFAGDGYGGGEEPDAFSRARGKESAAARSALDAWASVADIRFKEDGGSAKTDLRLARTDAWDFDAVAYAPYPDFGARRGDVWLNTQWAETWSDPSPRSYVSFVFLHEFGHALGLKHPHDGQFGGRYVLDAQEDSIQTSVMSYRDVVGAEARPSGVGSYPSTPMLNDIAAMQHLYGANTQFNAGNTVYRWTSQTADPDQTDIFATIWDAGGVDTIDWSNHASAATINLKAGSWSKLGNPLRLADGSAEPNTLALAYAYKNEAGAVINLIENAIGGSGNDDIDGNGVANTLRGRAGADRLSGKGGNDVLIGGPGNDRENGDAGADYAYGGGGNDVLSGGAGNDVLLGEAGADTLYGGAGFDYLYGGDGTDVGVGDGGTDVLYGEAGGDWLYGGPGTDWLLGGDGADMLFGDADADLLFGGPGNDRLEAGAGNDWHWAGTGADRFVFGVGWGHDVIFDYEDGLDRIDFSGTGTVAGMANLSIVDSGGYAVISDGVSSISIAGLAAAQLTIADFLF